MLLLCGGKVLLTVNKGQRTDMAKASLNYSPNLHFGIIAF